MTAAWMADRTSSLKDEVKAGRQQMAYASYPGGRSRHPSWKGWGSESVAEREEGIRAAGNWAQIQP